MKMEGCLRCGAPRARGSEFCSSGCEALWDYVPDEAAGQGMTLGGLIFNDIYDWYLTEHRGQPHPELFAREAFKAFTRVVDMKAQAAALHDFWPEERPVSRTPLQERVRKTARLATRAEYEQLGNAELRADARARVLADALTWSVVNRAIETAKRGPQPELPREIARAYAIEDAYDQERAARRPGRRLHYFD